MSGEEQQVYEPSVNEESDSNKRGQKLGVLASGERVYDLVPSRSSVLEHPEVLPVLGDTLTKITWPEGQTRFVAIEPSEVPLGKANVAPVPSDPQYEIVYAPRLDHLGRPRRKEDGSGVQYSRWVKGFAPDDIPDNTYIRIVLQKPSTETEDTPWVQTVAANGCTGTVPSEAGNAWFRSREERNRALAYWEGVGPDAKPLDTETRGHAFIYDEKLLAKDLVTYECPYDRIPDPEISLGDQARNAVAEGMMFAVHQNFLRGHLKTITEHVPDPELIPTFFKAAKEKLPDLLDRLKYYQQFLTREMCDINSVATLLFVHERFEKLFDAMVVLRGLPGKGAEAFKEKWEYHDYALFRDNEGMYYAASPSNYVVGKEHNPFTAVFSSTDIDEVLEQIKKNDGGIWPEGKSVTLALDSEDTGIYAFSLPNSKNGDSEKLIVQMLRISPDGPQPINEVFRRNYENQHIHFNK